LNNSLNPESGSPINSDSHFYSREKSSLKTTINHSTIKKNNVQHTKIVNDCSSIPANNTIYVNNINERLKRQELIQSLKHVFGQFGKILDVVCYTRILKAKGQAFIIFDQLESAQKAVREMQNFQFYNKPIRLSFAKMKSDIISKREGVYVPRTKLIIKRKEKLKIEIKAKKYIPFVKRPSKILKVSNLPLQSNITMVQMLFQK